MNNILYPSIKPYRTGFLTVNVLHRIYWECSGNPKGIPVLILHGGPGGASQPLYRRFFNPNKYNIIQFDQRGCGKSTPNAEISQNTTLDLVEDIEKLRAFLGFKNWHLFGGSWGSTLALIYSIKHFNRVNGLILRGVFLCRDKEILWFYQRGASELFPEEFDLYKSLIPEPERSSLIEAYYKRLTGSDRELMFKAAKYWTRWELSTSKLLPDPNYYKNSELTDFSLAFARLECHYFYNKIFLEDNFILNHLDPIKSIDVELVQGRYDVVCPARSAWDLHKALPCSKLHIVNDAGHSIEEMGISETLVEITDSL